jgi:hypothetical protein
VLTIVGASRVGLVVVPLIGVPVGHRVTVG